MLVDYLSPAKLERLHALAAARGQSLTECIDEIVDAGERQLGLRAPAQPPGRRCPLVELAGEFLVRLCAGSGEVRRVAAALRAAAVDGERSHVGPIDRDGLMLELTPQWEGVRIIVGEGRFVLSDGAALQLADRLLAQCRRPNLAA